MKSSSKGFKPSCKLSAAWFGTSPENEDHNVVKSSLPEISLPKTSLYDIIWETGITKHGNKVALVRKTNIDVKIVRIII